MNEYNRNNTFLFTSLLACNGVLWRWINYRPCKKYAVVFCYIFVMSDIVDVFCCHYLLLN